MFLLPRSKKSCPMSGRMSCGSSFRSYLSSFVMPTSHELKYDPDKCHWSGSGVKYTAREKDYMYHWMVCRIVGCRVKPMWTGDFPLFWPQAVVFFVVFYASSGILMHFDQNFAKKESGSQNTTYRSWRDRAQRLQRGRIRVTKLDFDTRLLSFTKI